MQTEEILSAGIDIGTSTTQLVFSKMVLQNIGGFGKIPQIDVISKEIIYKSDVYFTPLLSPDEIDGEKVNEIIKSEYKKAGIYPKDLSTGAVIITGESSRKRNAEDVVKAISESAGDFVVATAGADLESVLAGKGAGAAELSEKSGKIVVNLDIGGGTTNICVFEKGNPVDTACLDIGGRLIKTDGEKITYIAPKIKYLAEKSGVDIKVGKNVNKSDLIKITDIMASVLAEAVKLKPQSELTEKMKTNRLLTTEKVPGIITFSGGVAACFDECGDVFKYGDIGILLARSVLGNELFGNAHIEKSKETLRATVIGAGNYSMNISGSTIEYTTNPFPLKNLPVVKIQLENDEDIESLDKNLHNALRLYEETKGKSTQIAIAMKGLKCPSFKQIQTIAEKIAVRYDKDCDKENHLIIVLREDTGKALGQALRHFLGDSRGIICIDGISCESGDFIDLGEPIASGSVIPVIVKTLIFNGGN